MNKLSPTQADPFEPFQGGQKRTRFWQIVVVIQVVVIVFLAVLTAMVGSRKPDVISQPCGEPAHILHAEKDPPVTEDNARLFFLHMLKLRYGWDSMTVARDLDEYVGLCHAEQRQFERAYLTAMVTPDADAPGRKLQRRQLWVASQIKNTLLLPKLNDVACSTQGNGMWTCYLTATVETQRLFPPFDPMPKRRRSTFVGNFMPVDRTVDTPAGLIVGVLREVPEEKKDA